MAKTLFREQLHSIARQEIPDSLNLWPSIQKSLKQRQTRRRPVRKLIMRGLLISIILVTLLAVSVKTIPPLRVFSMNLLQSFSRAISDALDIEFTVLDPLVMVIAEEADYYAEDIEEASLKVGFDVLAPETLPDGYSLDKILAFKGIPYVSIWYKNTKSYASISITEYPPEIASEFVTICQNVAVRSVYAVDEAGNSHMEEPEILSAAESQDCDDLAAIGKSAEIQKIPVGGVAVEYVKGDWEITRSQLEQDDVTPGETKVYSYVWDPDYPRHRFRWESDGVVIEIDARDRQLTLEDYISLIESMF